MLKARSFFKIELALELNILSYFFSNVPSSILTYLRKLRDANIAINLYQDRNSVSYEIFSLFFFSFASTWTFIFSMVSQTVFISWWYTYFSLSPKSFHLPLHVYCPRYSTWASLVAQMVKNLPAVQETWVRSLGWEDPLEKGMATHSSILTWIIPWTEKPGWL